MKNFDSVYTRVILTLGGAATGFALIGMNATHEPATAALLAIPGAALGWWFAGVVDKK